jgi:hypothetical protein
MGDVERDPPHSSWLHNVREITRPPHNGEIMATSTLKKFLVLYLAPAHVLASWAKTDPATKQAAEHKMRGDWQRWMGDHAKMITLTEAAGKTKAVTSSGIGDTRKRHHVVFDRRGGEPRYRRQEFCGSPAPHDSRVLDRSHGNQSDGVKLAA